MTTPIPAPKSPTWMRETPTQKTVAAVEPLSLIDCARGYRDLLADLISLTGDATPPPIGRNWPASN